MFSDRRVLAVVPARGGSQGVKLKNLCTIGGVSLVALAGRVAREVVSVDRAVASTDHAEIARAAEAAGLAVPFMRPEALSGPLIGDIDVLRHALAEMEALDAVAYDVVLMLQPTSPDRTAADVEAALSLLVNGGYDSVWSVSLTDGKAHPLKQLVISAGGALGYYDPSGARIVARQQLAPVYHRNGLVYAITRECLLNQGTILGKRTGALVIDRPVSNIDTELDLEFANFLHARAAAGASG